MKRLLLIVTFLLALAVPTLAGEIPTSTAPAPPPPDNPLVSTEMPGGSFQLAAIDEGCQQDSIFSRVFSLLDSLIY